MDRSTARFVVAVVVAVVVTVFLFFFLTIGTSDVHRIKPHYLKNSTT